VRGGGGWQGQRPSTAKEAEKGRAGDKDAASAFKSLTVAQQLTAGALTLTDNVLASLSGKVRVHIRVGGMSRACTPAFPVTQANQSSAGLVSLAS